MRTFLLFLSMLVLACSAQAGQRGATITSISPTFGPPGTTVSIRGAGLAGSEAGSTWVKEVTNEPPPGIVEFNGVPGDVLFWQDDLISVRVPKGASTGPVRIVIARPRMVASGDVFDVYYSTPSSTPAKSYEVTADPRATEDESRNWREPRFRFDNDVPPPVPYYYANPWFSGLTPGERTFLGEQGFANTFLFGNPFSLGRKNSFFFGHNLFRDDGFRSGRFGFQSPFIGRSFFRGSPHTAVRPFWFRFR